MLNVHVQIFGDKDTIRRLNRLGREFRQWRSELTQVADYLQSFYENSVFETQGGVIGERWVSLSPFYELWKRKNFPGRGILERSGKMRHNWDRKINDEYLVLANMSDYAKYHQQPDGPGKGIIPKRTIIKFRGDNRTHVENIFKSAIIKKIGEASRS